MTTRQGWLLTIALLGLGCGKSEPTTPASVRGRVFFQGRPLAGGVIAFAPDREKGNAGRPFQAIVTMDGTYAIPANPTAPITPGWYNIAIAEPPGLYDEFSTIRFPSALRRPDRAGLAREIVPAQETVLDFLIEVPE